MRGNHCYIAREIQLPFKLKQPVLAFGAQSKNTLCFAERDTANLSPGHADLSRPQDFARFEKTVKYFLRRKPKIIACDPHPGYLSTKYAQLYAKRYPLSAIQHHHAHIASCMAENGLANQRVLGVAFDGTGLGNDGKLWGGEFLVCDYRSFRRRASLREIPLLGGEQAIREPARAAFAWLGLAYGNRAPLYALRRLGIDNRRQRVFQQMLSRGFNSPPASSMGRLFDAAASLILGRPRASFEAELAIELEKLVGEYGIRGQGYGIPLVRGTGYYLLDPTPMFKKIIGDLRKGVAPERIALRFHLAVAAAAGEICGRIRRQERINTVCLSGGVFQNKPLSSLLRGILSKDGFRVFTQDKVSCNDSGLSLGQAVASA
jgi:hydrogenase maturation protein HypF